VASVRVEVAVQRQRFLIHAPRHPVPWIGPSARLNPDASIFATFMDRDNLQVTRFNHVEESSVN
jgi:hypothetical protein